MSDTIPSTSPVHFSILGIACRWCGAEIPVQIPVTCTTPAEMLIEAQRQAAELHNCQPEVA